jgi:hypothetical protein
MKNISAARFVTWIFAVPCFICRRRLQRVSVCCRTHQMSEYYCRCVTICFRVLQCVAVCCSVMQCDAVCCSAKQCMLQDTSTCWVVLSNCAADVTVTHSVLHCVAVCYSLRQCVAGRINCWELLRIGLSDVCLYSNYRCFFLRKTLPPHFIRSEFLCTDSLSCIPAHTLRSGGNIVWSRSFSNVSCYIQDCHLSVSLSLRRQGRIVTLCFSLSLSCSFLSGVKVVS